MEASVAAPSTFGDARTFGMVRDDQEIQRRFDLDARIRRWMNDWRSLCEATGHVRIHGEILIQEGIGRVGSGEVRIAP